MRAGARWRSWLAWALSLWAWGTFAGAAVLPPWLAHGRPGLAAAQAVQALLNADDHGLRPDDYLAGPLQAALQALEHDDAEALALAPRFEQALTQALTQYLHDVRHGRSPAALGPALYKAQPPSADDLSPALVQAVAQGTLSELISQAAPALGQYAQIQQALRHYRTLGRPPAWSAPLPPLPAAKLEPGQPWAGWPQLAQRLQLLGDVPPGAPLSQANPTAWRDALTRFQRRHGLSPDGVIGRATLAALEVAPPERAQQLTLALERLRWTPLLQASRMIVINLPEFVLRAYEVEDGQPRMRLTMNVIVGKALDTRTPVFDETIRSIEFSPYWNIPPSIARAETVPRLRRDPSYFTQQGLEFVDTSGSVLTTLSAEHLQAVLQGRMRIRQRPGPLNALGDVKFIFPNNDNIYLHHTPVTQLFRQPRRDFSHGCIRVEDPVALARFVLAPQPEWTPERIEAAMTRRQSSTVRLAAPLPVVIAYSTALVKEGQVHFFADVYGHDQRLLEALAAAPALRDVWALPAASPARK